MVSKKLLVTVLISMLALTVTCIALIPAGGESSAKLYVNPSKVTGVVPGGRFSINISVAGVSDLKGYEIKLGYNTSILDCVGIEVFPEENLPTPNWNIRDAVGLVWVNVTYDGESITSEAAVTVARIQFKAYYGETVLHLYDTRLVDSVGGLITQGVEDGFFRNLLLGDLNRDRAVDIEDIVIVTVAFGSKQGSSKWNPVADLNQDGLIDIFDLVQVTVNFAKKI